MISELRELELLLRRHGHEAQGDAAAHALQLNDEGLRSKFEADVTGLGIWGGAGSVADVDLAFRSRWRPTKSNETSNAFGT